MPEIRMVESTYKPWLPNAVLACRTAIATTAEPTTRLGLNVVVATMASRRRGRPTCWRRRRRLTTGIALTSYNQHVELSVSRDAFIDHVARTEAAMRLALMFQALEQSCRNGGCMCLPDHETQFRKWNDELRTTFEDLGLPFHERIDKVIGQR